MKRRVSTSGYALAVTVATVLLTVAVVIVLYKQGEIVAAGIATFAITALCLAALFFMPMSVEVAEGRLTVMFPLRFRSFPLDEIESARICRPTMGERRICGSGGFCGYWGWFSERDFGKYFAYYGKASDCFIVTLKNGRKYMLGCSDPQAIVDAIGR